MQSSICLTSRSHNTPTSFVREILKVTQNKEVISFAGGLPNPISFPQDELANSMQEVVRKYGSNVFQYSTTQGLLELREWIANRYNQFSSLDLTAGDIIITSGSQQSLDLLGKILIEKGDEIILEEPAYLGAIQAFSQYEPTFLPVKLKDDGIDTEQVEELLESHSCKLAYVVPNFQNPTGIEYSLEVRKKLRSLFECSDTVLVEDDPYGELSFGDPVREYIAGGCLPNSVLLGSFSKTLSPGIRLGFLITKNQTIQNAFLKAKQASDLHSNIFSQYMIYEYLSKHDFDKHIVKIRELYQKQSACMVRAMEHYFPKEVSFTKPNGGMFLWATLPEHMSSMKLFDQAILEKVAFVPGDPFYINVQETNTLRLNYTNSSEEIIIEGIKRIGKIILKEI